jgi:hypothetical protein
MHEKQIMSRIQQWIRQMPDCSSRLLSTTRAVSSHFSIIISDCIPRWSVKVSGIVTYRENSILISGCFRQE